MKYTILLTICLFLLGCSSSPVPTRETYTFYSDGTVKSIGNFQTGKHADKSAGFQVYETYNPLEIAPILNTLGMASKLQTGYGNAAGYCDASAKNQLDAKLQSLKKEYPDILFAWSSKPDDFQGKSLFVLYALRIPDEYSTPVRGDGISAIEVKEEEWGTVLNITFLPETATRFGNLTSNNIGNTLAMVVDGQVLSAPTVQSAITTGQVQISGSFTPEEAENMKQTLEAYILNGEWRSYHKNGKLKEVRNYKNGEQTGSWSKYDENGNLISKRELK